MTTVNHELFTIDNSEYDIWSKVLPSHISLVNLTEKAKFIKNTNSETKIHNFDSFIPNHLNLEDLIIIVKSRTLKKKFNNEYDNIFGKCDEIDITYPLWFKKKNNIFPTPEE